jgi:hypothetical protein
VKGREGWFSMAKIGMMRGVSAEQLAQSLLAVWFGGTPPTRRAQKAKRGREAPVVSVVPIWLKEITRTLGFETQAGSRLSEQRFEREF